MNGSSIGICTCWLTGLIFNNFSVYTVSSFTILQVKITPRELAQELETTTHLPDGSEERFKRFGVMGLPFSSSHVLALRRFVSTSVGNVYTSVWHRSSKTTELYTHVTSYALDKIVSPLDKL